MDIDTAGPEDIPAEDPLMIDECSVAAALGKPEPEPAEPEIGPGPDPLAEKQYHDLEPAVASRAAPDAPSLLTVKQEACLKLPLTMPETEPFAVPTSTATRGGPTRRSRRLAVETVPFKKRKQIIAPELSEDEYILPDHVHRAAVEVEQAAQQTSKRRLRPKRSAQSTAAAVRVEHHSPDARDAVSLKQELAAGGGGPASSGEPEPESAPSVAPLPRKKRGRPRKSEAPQRCAPQEDVTAAGDGDSGARQPSTQEEEPQKPDEPQEPEEPQEPVRQRRGRKSAAPSRRGRPTSTSLPTAIASSPSLAVAEARDTNTDRNLRQQEGEDEPPKRLSPPVTDVTRVICAGLPVSEPVSLIDELRLLEVPDKHTQQPCLHCGSLTGCPQSEEHCHAPDTVVTPSRRLKVIVDGTAPSDSSRRRPVNLSDQDGALVSDLRGGGGQGWAVDNTPAYCVQ